MSADHLDIFKGRKFLGPLDLAQIRAINGKIEFAKMVMLDEMVNDIIELENKLHENELPVYERKICEMALKAREEDLNAFLGIENDRKNENG